MCLKEPLIKLYAVSQMDADLPACALLSVSALLMSSPKSISTTVTHCNPRAEPERKERKGGIKLGFAAEKGNSRGQCGHVEKAGLAVSGYPDAASSATWQPLHTVSARAGTGMPPAPRSSKSGEKPHGSIMTGQSCQSRSQVPALAGLHAGRHHRQFLVPVAWAVVRLGRLRPRSDCLVQATAGLPHMMSCTILSPCLLSFLFRLFFSFFFFSCAGLLCSAPYHAHY